MSTNQSTVLICRPQQVRFLRHVSIPEKDIIHQGIANRVKLLDKKLQQWHSRGRGDNKKTRLTFNIRYGKVVFIRQSWRARLKTTYLRRRIKLWLPCMCMYASICEKFMSWFVSIYLFRLYMNVVWIVYYSLLIFMYIPVRYLFLYLSIHLVELDNIYNEKSSEKRKVACGSWGRLNAWNSH